MCVEDEGEDVRVWIAKEIGVDWERSPRRRRKLNMPTRIYLFFLTLVLGLILTWRI